MTRRTEYNITRRMRGRKLQKIDKSSNEKHSRAIKKDPVNQRWDFSTAVSEETGG